MTQTLYYVTSTKKILTYSCKECAEHIITSVELCKHNFVSLMSVYEQLELIKVIDRPTQTPLCGFAVAAHEPLKFCSDVHIFERFSIFV